MSRIYLSPPHMGAAERDLLLSAYDSNWIAPLGPNVDGFERELAVATGASHCAALSSGTAALHLALILLGVGPGDRVIGPTFTFAATVNPVAYQRAELILCDADPGSWNLDPARLEEALAWCDADGRLPKAIIAVDLYGQAADWDSIRAIAARYGVPTIEDAAAALGATYKGRPAGGLADFGAVSFNGNKIITTSGGGALLSDRADAIALARKLSTQARDDAPHYEHTLIGYNYRLSNLLAAVGRGQLQVLADRVAARRANFAAYVEGLSDLPGVGFHPEASTGVCNRWLSCVTIDPARFGADREDVRKALLAHDIESRPLWKPMHQQPVFAGVRVFGGEVAAGLFDHGLALPSGSSLTRDDLDRVIAAFRACRS
jgi:pyridoxal phosphate-dependent aminotransferase EpsN